MNEQIRAALHSLAIDLRQRQSYIKVVSQILLELPGGEASFVAAQRKILAWMKPRARVALPPEAWAGKSFELNMTGAQPTEAVAIESPRYWAARLKDADKDVARRDWTTEIGLALRSEALSILGVRLTVSGTGENPEFLRSVPGLVRQIVDGLDARLDSKRITVEPRFVSTEEDFEDLVGLIENPNRKNDVIVFSLADGETTPTSAVCNPQHVQRKLLGAAHIAIITSPASYWLTQRFGKEWSVFRRAVRTYRPQFDRYQDDLRHHPLTLPARIEAWSGGQQAYENFLIEQSLWRTVTRPDLEKTVPSFLSVRQIASELAIEKAKESGSTDRELAGLFSAQAEELRVQINKQKETADALLDEAQGEIDGLKEEIEKLRARVRAKDAWIERLQSSRVTAVDETVPSDLEDVQMWCEQILGGTVTLLPRAYRGLKESVYEDVSLIYRSLLLLRDFYVPMRRIGGQELLKKFNSECRKLGITEEATGSEMRAAEHGDEYFVKVSGRRAYLDRHLKKGNSREARHCFRLYFLWDEDGEQVLVGWLPSHLDSRVT